MSSPPDMPSILVIEDDLDVAEMLDSYFRIQGYQVKTVNWGEDGLKSAKADCPDLVILDIRLPDIDGFEIAEQLRANRSTAGVPILFLTEKRQRQDRLRGLEIGGDDYITKPFDIQELRLRVRNALLRAGQPPSQNSITELPDGKLVDDYLYRALEKPDWAMLSIKLVNFDSFRDLYGFISADDALRKVSLLILNALRETGSPDDFLGHLAPDVFVTITTTEKIGKLEAKINTRGTQTLLSFYPNEVLTEPDSPDNRLQLNVKQFLGESARLNEIKTLKFALITQKPG